MALFGYEENYENQEVKLNKLEMQSRLYIIIIFIKIYLIKFFYCLHKDVIGILFKSKRFRNRAMLY